MPYTKEERNEISKKLYGMDLEEAKEMEASILKRNTDDIYPDFAPDRIGAAFSILSDVQHINEYSNANESITKQIRERINWAKRLMSTLKHSHPCSKEHLLEERAKLMERVNDIDTLLKNISK